MAGLPTLDHWAKGFSKAEVLKTGGGSGALPADTTAAICRLCLRIQKLPRLLVASSDGHLYIYNVDPQDGGECVLIKTHR